MPTRKPRCVDWPTEDAKCRRLADGLKDGLCGMCRDAGRMPMCVERLCRKRVSTRRRKRCEDCRLIRRKAVDKRSSALLYARTKVEWHPPDVLAGVYRILADLSAGPEKRKWNRLAGKATSKSASLEPLGLPAAASSPQGG